MYGWSIIRIYQKGFRNSFDSSLGMYICSYPIVFICV